MKQAEFDYGTPVFDTAAGRAGSAVSRRLFLASLAGGAAVFAAAELPAQQTSGLVTVDARQTLGQVPNLAFGMNLLATRDDIRGTFGARLRSTSPTLLRWPGGEISHSLFRASGRLNNTYRTRLWPFLTYCRRNGIVPAIVVPTESALDGNMPKIRRAVRRLADAVTAGLGDPTIPVLWELGNEAYAETFQTPENYGFVVNQMIDVIRAARGDKDPIGIIAGRPTGAITDWSEPLSRVVDQDKYDYLTFHSYPFNHLIYTLRHMATAQQHLGRKPYFVSEWSHYSCWNPEYGFSGGNCTSVAEFTNNTYGISLAGAMVSHFAQMMTYDVFAAAFWALQQNNMTAMFPNEGVEPDRDPYIAGQVFNWLRDTAGMRVVHIQQTGDETTPAVFAFANDERMFIYVDARNSTQSSIDIDVRNFTFSQYYGRRLSGENDVRAMTATEGPARAVRWGNTIRVPLRVDTSHELIRIVLEA